MVADRGGNPGVDRGAANPGRDRGDPEHRDGRRQRVRDQRDQSDGASESQHGHGTAAIGDHAPDREGDGGGQGGQDADHTDVRKLQVQPIDVDEREQRCRRDQPTAVEALGKRDPAKERSLAKGLNGLAGRERHAEADIAERTGDPEDAGHRDRSFAADAIGKDPAPERRERTRGRSTHPDHADDPATQSGRVHRAPQSEMKRAAEGDAEPERNRHCDHDRRWWQQEEDEK